MRRGVEATPTNPELLIFERRDPLGCAIEVELRLRKIFVLSMVKI